jgi:PBSX family phage terminase large subunit
MSEENVVREYEPSGKGMSVHASTARFIIAVGGMGSGKSRCIIEELIQSGLDYKTYKMAVYRKTMPSLRDSTLHEYKQYCPAGVGEYKERLEQYRFYGEENKSSFINFRGLDDPNKAKSTNYHTIVMEEADEFTYQDFTHLNARIRADGASGPLRIILCLNPCDDEHWIYKQFVENAESWDRAGRVANGDAGPGLLVIHFSTYDNIKNLPPGYIESMTAGMTPDEISRYIHGQWGSIIKGTPVYAKLLKPDLHLRKLTYDGSQLICRGWDFGFNRPACVFRLVDTMGRKNIHKEMLGDKEHLDVFARKVMKLTEENFKGAKIFDYCDPRGHDKKDSGESSVDLLRGLGIWPIGERGVREYVEPGIQVVRKELSTLIEGIPELTIDPSCSIMRAAFFGKYVRDDDGRPKKDGYYEHLMDADRYIAYNDKSNSVVRDIILNRKNNRPHQPRNKHTGY